MAQPQPVPPRKQPLVLHEHAMDNLRFIRETMERSTVFTSLPGAGAVAIGAVALAAAWRASLATSLQGWLAVWLGAAAVAVSIAALTTAQKIRRAKSPSSMSSLRNFVLGLAPPLAAGALLTPALARNQSPEAIAAVWLLLYGTAIVTGGAYSIRVVPVMGVCFMALGSAALFAPAGWGDVFMAVGFGGLHIVFGAIVLRRFGG
jgi:hypothetical protein